MKIKILKSLTVFTIIFSLSLGQVSFYSNAAEVVMPLDLSFWQTLWASLGFTCGLAEGVESNDSVIAEQEEFVINGLTEQGMSEDEARDFLYNGIVPDMTSTSSSSFIISRPLWNSLKDICKDTMSLCCPTSLAISDTCLTGMNKAQFVSFVESYFDGYVHDSMSSHPKYKNFLTYAYDNFTTHDFFIMTCTYDSEFLFHDFTFYTNFNSYDYSFKDNFVLYSSNSYCARNAITARLLLYDDGTTRYSTDYYYTDILRFGISQKILFVVDGYLYDPFDIFFDSDFSSITSLLLKDDVISPNYKVKSLSAKTKNVVELLRSDAYEILTDGQTYDEEKKEVVGDVVLDIPNYDYINGLLDGSISWEQFMEEVGATPIDTSDGTNILTDEFLTINTGILSNTDSILDVLQNIFDSLLSLPLSIVQALCDALLSLFVPAEGFIDGKVAEIDDKLVTLGIVPYDMGQIFDTGDTNPFKDIKITIYGKEVTIVSFAYLPPFLNKFRPAIRGLMVLFMLFYSINQFLALFRIGGMMQGGNINSLSGMGIPGTSEPARITDKGGRS